MGLAGPSIGLPLVAVAGSAALFGGSVGAAVTRPRPKKRALRTLMGIAGGALSAFGFIALAHVLDIGDVGVVIGGWLGGLALGALLGAEEKMRPSSHVAGLFAASTTGAVGALALVKMAEYATSESAPTVLTAAAMAGVMGLWVAAASGLRRLETVRDPLVIKGELVLEGLVDPVKKKVHDGLDTWNEIEDGIKKTENMSTENAAEARKQARTLVESLLETAQTWKQIHGDLSSPRLKGIEDKLIDMEKRAAETTDVVTAGHLQRASQALRAQKAAIDGLKVGCDRAEAALDAQTALLERLRLAVAQHRVSDRERFAVEVSAVADQVARLSDDLESLSAAIAEAEALSDRKLLADLERAGRRALTQLDGVAESTKVDATVDEKVEAGRGR
ncbi:MAG TPA: hypothetical protein VGO62_06870 [Myxococcota bacterium]